MASTVSGKKRWCHLNNRFGRDNASPPSDAELLLAASEVLDESSLKLRYPTLTEGDLAEHPDAWLESGVDGGQLESLILYRGGRIEFVRYTDVDMTDEVFRVSLEPVDLTKAMALFSAMRDGRIDEVEAVFFAQSVG